LYLKGIAKKDIPLFLAKKDLPMLIQTDRFLGGGHIP
jgi:hypothetical protein